MSDSCGGEIGTVCWNLSSIGVSCSDHILGLSAESRGGLARLFADDGTPILLAEGWIRLSPLGLVIKL
jgi:hypothetical protein